MPPVTDEVIKTASDNKEDRVAAALDKAAAKEKAPNATAHRASRYANQDKLDDWQNNFLKRIVEDAGRWAFGTVFVEVWILNDSRTHLIRPDNGWWMDPYFHECGHRCALCRLTDSQRSDFIKATPLAPGVGLPGALWSETKVPMLRRKTTKNTSSGSGRSAPTATDTDAERKAEEETFGNAKITTTVKWRQIKPLADDPDQPWNPRLQYLANECKLGWAAGVPFHVGGSEGLVVYMARESADITKLKDEINETYLSRAALLIGSAISLQKPRYDTVQARREELQETIRRVKTKVFWMVRLGKTFETVLEESVTAQQDSDGGGGGKVPSGDAIATGTAGTSVSSCLAQGQNVAKTVCYHIQTWAKKSLGAGNLPPPVKTWEQSLYTFVCALITLLILTRINVSLIAAFGNDFGIIMGPFGALLTLQYGLTAAPASQPRNAVVGQAVSLIIAQCIGKYTDPLEIWAKQSIATALSIALMAKLGVIHPPAGAGALLFAAGKFHWNQVGIMLMANCVAIVCATFFNNWSSKRQYPTFWGIGFVYDAMCRPFGDKKTPEKPEKAESSILLNSDKVEASDVDFEEKNVGRQTCVGMDPAGSIP